MLSSTDVDSIDKQNYLHHMTWVVQGATWPFFAVATVLFGIRCISRVFLRGNGKGTSFNVSWEDVIITFSWMLDVIRIAFLQRGLALARDVYIDDLQNTVPGAVFWLNLCDIWSFISVTTPKLAIGLLLIRIFRPKKWLKWTILGVCFTLIAASIAGFVISFVQCDPVSYLWDPYKSPNGHCWPTDVAIIYSCFVSAFSATVDLAFSAYPGYVISTLQMPRWKKLSTMVLMGLGVGAFAFGIVKLVSNTGLIGQSGVYSRLYNCMYIGLWNSIENDFVLSAACLPASPPFFRMCRNKISYLNSSLSLFSFDTRYHSRSKKAQLSKESDSS